MKTKLLLFTTLLMAALSSECFLPHARAAGITVGAYSWYSWWEYSPKENWGEDFKPGLFYGPILGFDFAEKWSISSVFLTGNMKYYMEGSPIYQRRYDSDTILSYNITRWMKLFGGLKYLSYDMNFDGSKVSVFGDADAHYKTWGPGVGIGFTIPVYGSLYLLANFSGIYCHGRWKFDGVSEKVNNYGYNTNISLAYYIASMATTIVAGFRYQYIHNSYETWDNDSTRFYGITMSATYHLSLNE
jgi:hypothetical protein